MILKIHLFGNLIVFNFQGKVYGLKANFGEGSYLQNPLELIDKRSNDPK